MKIFFAILSVTVFSLSLTSLSFAQYSNKIADEVKTVNPVQKGISAKVPKVRPTGRSIYGKKKAAAAATTNQAMKMSGEVKKEMK